MTTFSFNPQDYSLTEILKPAHTALLVIDMQNDFLAEGGFYDRKKRNIKQMQSIVPYIQRLIVLAHSKSVPVIFTQGYEDIKFRKGPDLRRAVKWSEQEGEGRMNSQSGTWGAEFFQLKPTADDIILEKHKWSAFSGKNSSGQYLEKILQDRSIKTLVITGVVAQTCIETTIRDAYSRDYFVVIPEHSIGSNDELQLATRMSYWKGGHIGDVLDEAEIEKNLGVKISSNIIHHCHP